jgi:ribosomal protein S19E (S16A)
MSRRKLVKLTDEEQAQLDWLREQPETIYGSKYEDGDDPFMTYESAAESAQSNIVAVYERTGFIKVTQKHTTEFTQL